MEAGPPNPPPKPAKPPTGERQVAAERPATTLDGLRAWVAQLDRKLGVRFYALGAAVVLALAAAIVALVLALGLEEDSATRADVEALRDEVAEVQESAADAARKEISTLSDRLDQLESQLRSLRSDSATAEQRLSVVEDDIGDLRTDLSRVESQVERN